MFHKTYCRLLTVGQYYTKYPKRLMAGEVTKIIRRQFSATDFSFRTHRDAAVDLDMIIIAGTYDCFNDTQGVPYVEITLCYNPNQSYYFTNLLDWKKISFDIAECIGHEIVHQVQHKTKTKLTPYTSNHTNPVLQEDQEYLGDESEIEAYGFSIAAEMVTFNKPFTECDMYCAYLQTFDNDHSVIVKLEKQIRKYLMQLGVNNEQSNGQNC